MNTATLVRRFVLSAPLAILLLSSTALAESRTWTSSNGGNTITGTAVKFTGAEVTILTDAKKTLKVKTSQLSEEDRTWLKDNKDSIGKTAGAAQEKSEIAKQFEGDTSIISRSGKASKEDVKPNAKYYLILFSASWCGPCRAEMPLLVKEYNRKIKNNPDLELIHKSADRKLDAALTWAKDEKIPFPTVLPETECFASVLGLSKSSGIPSLMIVTASGEKVIEDHPARLLKSYEKEIEKYEASKGAPSEK